MGRFFSGMRFGNQTFLEKDLNRKKRWIVKCDCGDIRSANNTNFSPSKNVKMCKSCSSKISNITHGLHDTVEYKLWKSMNNRCYQKSNLSYKHYGGRGITVCDRWKGRGTFLNFLDDMGHRPSSIYSIDRIDSNGSYCKENCRWATRAEQARNRRSSRYIKFAGMNKVVRDWETFFGVRKGTISQPINKQKKPPREVLEKLLFRERP